MTWKVSADPLDFDEAIAWFRKRVPMTREQADALDATARLQAFWVSHVAQADIVGQAWAAIDKALAKGTTLEDFKKEIGSELRRAWSGSVDDPAWRLETIFRTNLQSAYAAGRYKQATHPDVLADHPIWMFDAVLDGRETDVCRKCDGTKLPADHPWWETHVAPLHYKCRSSVVTLTEAQAGKLTSAPADAVADDGFGGVPRDDSWTPAHDRYPDELAYDFREKTKDPPAPPPRLTFVDSIDASVVKRLGATSSGDIKRVTKALFDGRCPDQASWLKLWEPPPGYRIQFDRFDASDGETLSIKGRVMHGKDDVGDIERTFKRRDGELVVKHDFLVLKPSLQGKGIGDALSRSALLGYREMDVRRVLVSAHWVGRYTWATFGYSWSASDAPRWQKALAKFLTRELGNAKLAEEYANTALEGAHAVASLVIDGEKLGKAFLLDDDFVPYWNGELRLVDGDVGYEKAKRRLQL